MFGIRNEIKALGVRDRLGIWGVRWIRRFGAAEQLTPSSKTHGRGRENFFWRIAEGVSHTHTLTLVIIVCMYRTPPLAKSRTYEG